MILLALVAAGCTSDVDARGTYTISVANRTNGCNLENWTVGDTASNITVGVTQESNHVTADVMGVTRIYLDIVLGGHIFTGSVHGDELDLLLESSRSRTTGNCVYTINAHMLSRLQGDVLTGRINYESATNGNSDCAGITGCVSYQDMNGTRPPT